VQGLFDSIDDKSALQKEPWELIKDKLSSVLDPHDFETWIHPLKPVKVSDKEILIETHNLVFYQGIMDRYWSEIEKIKIALGLENFLIRFEIACDYQDPETEIDEGPQSSNPVVSRALSENSTLNPNYTFDTFVRGDSNQFAHATCLAVADSPGQTYNPLFIYGSTGLGKTHLLHAVGCKILSRFRGSNILYISSERFMNEMIYCLRFNKMWAFRNKYRNCDVFLVDDIHFISGKDRTQEEFFHTFNTLYEQKKQIIITSDLFPQDIPDIEDRLRNRFQWGLIADIQPPAVEHRVAILLNKAHSLGVQVSQDVCLYLANHAKRNIRELEGALHRLCAFSSFHGRPINLDLAQETFRNMITEAPPKISIETIQKLVAEHFKIKSIDLKSKRRQRALTVPRQVAMYLSRKRTQSSFPEIGERFGGKDHTTVMHAVKKIELDVSKDVDLRTAVEALERKLDQQY
jgi:chromosomal replication initiator protein